MSLNDFFYMGRVDLFNFQRIGTQFFLGVFGAAYLVYRRKQGDLLRESAFVALLIAVAFTMPGVSYCLHRFGIYDLGRNALEVFPTTLLAAEAAVEVLHQTQSETKRRRAFVLAFLFMLIPIGISAGMHYTLDHISFSKDLWRL